MWLPHQALYLTGGDSSYDHTHSVYRLSLLLAQEGKGELVDGYVSNASNNVEAQLLLATPI